MDDIIYKRVIEPYNVRTEVPDNPKYMVFCDTCDDVRYYNQKQYSVVQNMDIPRCLNCGFYKPVKVGWRGYIHKEYVTRGRLTQLQLRGTDLHKRCCHVCHKEIQTDMQDHQKEVHNMKFGRGVARRGRNGKVLYSHSYEETYSIPALELSTETHYNIKAMFNGFEPKYENNRKLSKCCGKICDSYGMDEGGYGFCSICGELAEFYEEYIEMVRNKEIISTDYYKYDS